MTKNTYGLSVYEGFFSGGARVLHSDVISGLHEQGQKHSIFSIHNEVRRENTIQKMEDDPRYRALSSVGIPVSYLSRYSDISLAWKPFSDLEIEQFADQAAKAEIILSLKEQPLQLVKEVSVDKPLVVCLHRSDPEHQGPALAYLQEMITLGKVSACIVSAEAAKQAYIAKGIPASLLHVVVNGIDLSKFTVAPEKRNEIRQQFRIPEEAATVILAARFDAMKNVPLFLESAKLYLTQQPQAHVIMCGAGMSTENKELSEKMTQVFGEGNLSIKERIHLLGIRRDMAAIYTAADIVALTSSRGETYPLCLLEGMACGAIPVSTDVGDTKLMLEGRGIITPPDPTVIAQAWQEAYARREEFLTAITTTIVDFDRSRMINSYQKILSQVA